MRRDDTQPFISGHFEYGLGRAAAQRDVFVFVGRSQDQDSLDLNTNVTFLGVYRTNKSVRKHHSIGVFKEQTKGVAWPCTGAQACSSLRRGVAWCKQACRLTFRDHARWAKCVFVATTAAHAGHAEEQPSARALPSFGNSIHLGMRPGLRAGRAAEHLVVPSEILAMLRHGLAGLQHMLAARALV